MFGFRARATKVEQRTGWQEICLKQNGLSRDDDEIETIKEVNEHLQEDAA